MVVLVFTKNSEIPRQVVCFPLEYLALEFWDVKATAFVLKNSPWMDVIQAGAWHPMVFSLI
jgi:hypothetical protein